MTRSDHPEPQRARELAQLLRLHERLMSQLEGVRTELAAPGTGALLRDIRRRTGISTGLSEVTAAVEGAIRALELADSKTRATVFPAVEDSGDGDSPLPVKLQRFLAERKDLPGFSYDVVQDEVRGWVIRWKEHTDQGTVRGYGQFYERPYAWLDD